MKKDLTKRYTVLLIEGDAQLQRSAQRMFRDLPFDLTIVPSLGLARAQLVSRTFDFACWPGETAVETETLQEIVDCLGRFKDRATWHVAYAPTEPAHAALMSAGCTLELIYEGDRDKRHLAKILARMLLSYCGRSELEPKLPN